MTKDYYRLSKVVKSEAEVITKCDRYYKVRQIVMIKRDRHYPVDTGRKLNVHKRFRRRPGRLLNVLCTFDLRPASTGCFIFRKKVFVIAANIYRQPQTQMRANQNGRYQLFVKKYTTNKFCEFDGVFGIRTSCDT